MAASSREPQHPKARPARGVIGHSIDTSKSKTLMTRGRGLAKQRNLDEHHGPPRWGEDKIVRWGNDIHYPSKSELVRLPIGLLIGQSVWDIFSFDAPSSQVTVVCQVDKKTTSRVSDREKWICMQIISEISQNVAIGSPNSNWEYLEELSPSKSYLTPRGNKQNSCCPLFSSFSSPLLAFPW